MQKSIFRICSYIQKKTLDPTNALQISFSKYKPHQHTQKYISKSKKKHDYSKASNIHIFKKKHNQNDQRVMHVFMAIFIFCIFCILGSATQLRPLRIWLATSIGLDDSIQFDGSLQFDDSVQSNILTIGADAVGSSATS